MLCVSRGAKGVDAFAHSLGSKKLPKESSIEYEGLYFNYYFETGIEEAKDFSPKYSHAICHDPLSGEREYYVCVGLTSRLDGEGFYKHGGRSPLNFVIVLDVSGSMTAHFKGDDYTPKLRVAIDSILGVLNQLKETDQFGMITFNEQAHVIQPIALWKDIDKASLKEKLMKIREGGGTSLSAGMDGATKMIKEAIKAIPTNQHRIFYFTDMMVTSGDLDSNKLLEAFRANADLKIYTTFIGIGVDFDTDMAAAISKTRACNYFSVHSPSEFKTLMSEEFDYVVSPNVFDIKGTMKSEGWKVERVFGSPGFEIPIEGTLYFIDSSFPSGTRRGETKGGVILIKLQKDPNQASSSIQFTVEYTTVDGKKFQETEPFVIGEDPKDNKDVYQNSCVRKAVLLTRYVSFMKHFLRDEMNTDPKAQPSISLKTGITPPPLSNSKNSATCHMKPLNNHYKGLMGKFIAYCEKEAEILEDPTLHKELVTLHDIMDYKIEN